LSSDCRFALATLACCAVATAQTTTPDSALQGVVSAKGSGPLAGATVTISQRETGQDRTTRTGPRGEYRFASLPVGHYQVSVRAKGMKTLEGIAVGVDAGQTSIANFTLDRHEANAYVVVTSPKGDFHPLTPPNLDEAGLASLRASTSDTASLLRDIPGVSLLGAGGVSSLPVIHGMADDRVRVKVDGRDLLSACPNHMNSPLSYIDPTHVGSVKVFAGIAPVSLGGDSIAGTILVDAAPPEFAAPGQGTLFKGQAGLFYRSNGNAKGAHLAAIAAGENLNLTYSGSLAESGNFKAARAFKAAGLAAAGRDWLDGDVVGSSRYKTENQELGLALRRDHHLLELKLGWQDIPYEGFPNQRMDMTGNRSAQVNLHYTGQYRWGALEARIYNEKTRHKMDFAEDKQFFYGSAATILAPGMPMNTEGRNTGALVKAEFPMSEGHLLRVGGEGQSYRLDDWWPPSPSVLPSGYTVGGMAPNTFWDINDGHRNRFDLYAEWEARWNPQWASQAGIRVGAVYMDTGNVQGYNDTAMYNGAPFFPATTFNGRDRKRVDHNWDLTALVRYAPGATQSYEAGIAQKTRSPNLYERYAWSLNTMAMEMVNFSGDGNYYVGNLDLKPEVARTFSATADWHDAAQEQWGVKVTPFFTFVQDYIDVRRFPGTSAAMVASLTAKTGFVYLQFVNQSARLFGVDLSGHFLLAKTACFGRFTASGVLSQVRGENRTTGDNLYDIMPMNAKLAVMQGLGDWTNTLEAQWVDAKARVSQVRDEVRTGGYALLNLRSSYTWKQARFDLSVENLFNKFYAHPLSGAYTGQGPTMSGNAIPWGVPVPGMGRSIHAALNVRF
jgi:iron complex outermembrane receptor protein